jgi:molybdopterin converting factor subunit 1
MRVRVLFFGVLRDQAGEPERWVELPAGATVVTLLRLLQSGSSNCRMPVLDHGLAVAVNREYSTGTAELRDGDEVALLPPVSGGLDGAAHRVEIVDGAILTEEILASIKQSSDGAICVFDGIVRDNTRGRRTLHLDYEAYREMALAQMRSLADEAASRFAIREIALVHRLGRLEVGDTSVLIAVASAHRGAAFDACRWLIDTLKKTVPIWKRETFADGAVWADGEPFPAGMAVGPAEPATTASSKDAEESAPAAELRE